MRQKLALKAAQETAGDSRQRDLLQANTDLAAAVLEPQRIQEIVSRRTFGGGWKGSRHAYEAGLLSCIDDFRGDARSRLRMAYEWLENWSRLPQEERENERIKDEDIAEITLARFNIDGAEACANDIRSWSPKEVSYRTGRIITRRFVDHGRYCDVDLLALAATNNLCLLLAINLELRAVHRSPPKETVERALRLILDKRIKIKERDFDFEETVLQTITALVESAHVYKLRSNDILASLLQRYLPKTPPHRLAERHISTRRVPLIRAYALQSTLKNGNLQLVNLAHPELREQLEGAEIHHGSQSLREFMGTIGALLPWYKLWAEHFIAPMVSSVLLTKINTARKESTKAEGAAYFEKSRTSNEIGDVWFDILANSTCVDDVLLQEFKIWTDQLERPLFTPTWTNLARIAAHTPNFENYAYNFAQKAFELTKTAKEDAESKGQTYVKLARAILIKDNLEAKEYFNQAIEVASKIGDEILDRWQAILHLADCAANESQPSPQTAYKLARCAELAYKYDDDHFEWDGTVTAIAGLCPSSCFAILSRWRDRDFGRSERLNANAISFLLDRGDIHPKIVSALVGFRANWQYGDLMQKIFAACDSQADRERVLNFVLYYMRLEGQSSSVWEPMKQIAGGERPNHTRY